MIELLN